MITINKNQISSIETSPYIPTEKWVQNKELKIFGRIVRKAGICDKRGYSAHPAQIARLYLKPDGAIFEKSRMVVKMKNLSKFERCFYNDEQMYDFLELLRGLKANLVDLPKFTEMGLW